MRRRTKIIVVPSVESIRKFLKDYGHDGWSILHPEGLIKDYGFAYEFVEPLVFDHKSRGGKYDITSQKTGKVVKSLRGVHTLTVLARLCSLVGGVAEGKLGRGSQAGAYTSAIIAKIGAE